LLDRYEIKEEKMPGFKKISALEEWARVAPHDSSDGKGSYDFLFAMDAH
jgi:hypothetical protein